MLKQVRACVYVCLMRISVPLYVCLMRISIPLGEEIRLIVVVLQNGYAGAKQQLALSQNMTGAVRQRLYDTQRKVINRECCTSHAAIQPSLRTKAVRCMRLHELGASVGDSVLCVQWCVWTIEDHAFGANHILKRTSCRSLHSRELDCPPSSLACSVHSSKRITWSHARSSLFQRKVDHVSKAEPIQCVDAPWVANCVRTSAPASSTLQDGFS